MQMSDGCWGCREALSICRRNEIAIKRLLAPLLQCRGVRLRWVAGPHLNPELPHEGAS
jgi:hypothetical protein